MAADDGETLYLFDGYNLLHASGYEEPRELVDALASFVALRGSHGIVVFDGAGGETVLGSLEVRYAPHADALLERLAVANRGRRRVLLVSSDTALRDTVGLEVGKLGAAAFVRDLVAQSHKVEPPAPLAERLDPETRARLERWRRGR